MSTTQMMPEVSTQAAPKNILDNAYILEVRRRWPPLTKTISSPILNSTANVSMISTIKKLFNSAELKAIVAEEVKLDEFLKRTASPFPFKKGHHLLAFDLYGKVENYFQEHVIRRNQKIDEFVAAYDKAVEEAKQLLGDQFNQNDYPPASVIRSYFHLNHRYWQFSIAEKLVAMDQVTAQRQQEAFDAEILQAGQAATALLAEQMQGLLTHLADRLTPVTDEETGELKRKTFRDKMLDPINDFLAIADSRNLEGNQQIKSLADKVRALMNGVTVDSLKANADLRSKLEQQIKEVKEEVDKYVTDMPLRAISFEE